jgi:nickel/cobalt transporter (NicO) family protein
MKLKHFRSVLLSSLIVLVIHLFTIAPSQAHWADLASADITINPASAQMQLTIPTGLVATADTDRNGQLSPSEIATNQGFLQTQLSNKIKFTNDRNQPATLQVSAISGASTSRPSSSTNDRSTLQLTYSWPQTTNGVKIYYDLFEPGIQTARCITTIVQNKTVKNVIFSPSNKEAILFPDSPLTSSGFWVTIVGAALWGAAHAISPGHGKTLVGAYLIGEKATMRHALLLGLTTTMTHTFSIFILGGITLLASQSFLPEQLFPWMSLVSGLLVVGIGALWLTARLSIQFRISHSINEPRTITYLFKTFLFKIFH